MFLFYTRHGRMTHPSPYKAKKAAVCSSEIAAAVFRVDLINKKLENKGTT